MRKITIDLNSINNLAYFENTIRQGENLATEIEFVLSDDFTGYKYLMIFQLNNKTPVTTGELTPDDGKVSYIVTSAVTNEPGKLRVELHAYDDNGTLIKTAFVELKITQSISGIPEVMPESYVPWYILAVEQATIATNKAAEATATAESIANSLAQIETNKNDIATHTAQINDLAVKLNLKSDGTDNASIINSYILSLGTNNKTIIIADGIYDISTNVIIPANIDLLFRNGGFLRINTGATLTINSNIYAGNYEIFVDNGGIVDLDNTSNMYNLSWFMSGTGYINERWNFAKKGMHTFRSKSVVVPKPHENQAGTLNESGHLSWLFSDEFKVGDNQNNIHFYMDCEFVAANDCANFIFIGDAAKPEDIYFHGNVSIRVPPNLNVDCCININATARTQFFGKVGVGGAKTPIIIGGATGQLAPVTEVRFLTLDIAFFSQTAILIQGSSYSVQNLVIDNLVIQAAQLDNLNALEIKGAVRNAKIGNVYYATDVAKDGYLAKDVNNVVLLKSTSTANTMTQVVIDSIYQAHANNCLKIDSDTTSPSQIVDITVNNILGKYHGDAVILNYCKRVTINNIQNEAKVTLESNCYYARINGTVELYDFINNGSGNALNGVVSYAGTIGVAPSPNALYQVGTFIRNTADGKVYLRVAYQKLASDYILLN